MSTRNFINDGTGKGFSAKVNANNQLLTFSENRTEFETQVIRGKAFCVGSGVLSFTITADSALFRMVNTSDTDTIVIVDIITDRINLTTAGTAPLVQFIPGVTGFSGAETELTLVNRLVNDPYSFPARAFRPDTVGQTLVGGGSTPLTGYLLPPSDIDNYRAPTYAAIGPGQGFGIRIQGVGGAMSGGEIGVAALGYVVDLEG